MGILEFYVPVLGIIELAVGAIISIGIAVLSGYLMSQQLKKIKSPLGDDRPQTLSTRGDYINLVIGRRRTGIFFGWVGNRRLHTPSGGGGKSLFGSSAGSGGKIATADGWQILALGPAFALHKIWENGKTIFTGPITPETHPSGTRVDLGWRIGSFEIYWGEKLQPINTFLGHFDRVGINSRWPFLCYVVWIRKYLGLTSTWPLLEYELEVRPYQTSLTTPSWLDNLDPVTPISGANIGHIIDQLLFQKYPHGAGLSKEFFDMASLETLSNSVNFGD